MSKTLALTFSIQAECKVTKARTAVMKLSHYDVKTPVFMPVGTQGTMKGLLPQQLEELDCEIILGNTYHLGNRPGTEVLEKAGGLHKFMGWKRALLTDSGGFQMVSLLKLAEISEEGVRFRSPYDDSEIMLTPEKSIEIQNCIGADIIMQLDDVVRTTSSDTARVREAALRTSRWLERCLKAHGRDDQAVFPIVQGLLDEHLRTESARRHAAADVLGFAIGGLSGGEAKESFWRMVALSCRELPTHSPRYLMGVGLPLDLVICVALGVDMFDCVLPTRTARFGCALIDGGQINLKQGSWATDPNPIDPECPCTACSRKLSRAYLHALLAARASAGCHFLSLHNIAYQMGLMRRMREHIAAGTFSDFVKYIIRATFPDRNYPEWVVNSLKSVNIDVFT